MWLWVLERAERMLKSTTLRGLHWGVLRGRTHPFEGAGCHRFEVVGAYRVGGGSWLAKLPRVKFTPGQFFGLSDALVPASPNLAN